MKVQSNQEKKTQIISVLQNLIKEIKKSPELLEADMTVTSKGDYVLYQATGTRRTLSKTYEVHVEIK